MESVRAVLVLLGCPNPTRRDESTLCMGDLTRSASHGWESPRGVTLGQNPTGPLWSSLRLPRNATPSQGILRPETRTAAVTRLTPRQVDGTRAG